MTERARAIPLAALVGIVGLLVALRLVERTRGEGAGAPGPAGAPVARPLSVDASVPLARALMDAGADAAPTAEHMLHGDARRTHRASALGPSVAKLGWKARIGAPIEAQVVASLDEQTLYVAALDGSLTALAAKDGARLWGVSLGDRAYSAPCVGPGGTIYVGSDAKRFYAITPQGTVAWKLETSGEADTGAVLAGDLVVFAAGASVFAVRGGGEVAWRFDAKKKVFTAPAIGKSSLVVFGSQDHHVYALTPTGVLAWAVDLGADVDGAPAIADDDAIVVGTDGGEVVRLTASGDVVSRVQVGGYVRGPLSIARNGDALAGVYGPLPRLVRVSPAGQLEGSFPIHGTGSRELGVHGGPLEDARGALFFGAQDDVVHGLGPGGAFEWAFTTGGDVDAPLTLLSSGALIAASDDGSVYRFDP